MTFRVHCSHHGTDLVFPSFWSRRAELGFQVVGEVDLQFEDDSLKDYQHFDKTGAEVDDEAACEFALVPG